MNNMPWTNSYPAGVRWDREITPAPLQTILDNTVAKWPDRPAIDFMGKRLSYRELGDYVNRAACGLQQLGVKPGVHVGLYLPNTPHYVIAFFAVLKAGGTVVNYSPLDAATVLEHKIEDSRTDFLITLDMASLYPQMEAMLGKTRLKKLIVGSMAEMTSTPDAVTAEMKAAKQLSEIVWDDRHVSFVKLLDPPLPLELAQQFTAITGCNMSEGWGMTETSPTGTFTPVNGKRKAGSCGMPMPGIIIKFLSLDKPTQYVPLGERGEICIKGPNVMKGYWNNAEATADVTTFDGFMRTGDVGYMDEDGFVFIVDRTKDMLLCSGFNVYPRVLEEAIYKHPAVELVAVIGIPDKYRGQSPKAFVKLKASATAFTLEQLQAFLKDKLGKHEMVQALEIRPDLPMTAVGKPFKTALYDEEERKTAARA